MSRHTRYNKSEISLLAAARTLDHVSRFSEQTVAHNSITSWHRMQMNHNMGRDGIKDPSLINDKPGWNLLFHVSATGKPQSPWKHTQTPTRTWSFQLFNSFKLAAGRWRRVPRFSRHGVWFCQASGAGLRLWGEGKSCLCSAVFSSAQTDARGPCKWQPEPEDVCWLPRGLLQPAGEVSAAPYGAGKINNERKFSGTAGVRGGGLRQSLLQTKFKDVEKQERGSDKINGVQRLNATPTAMFAQKNKNSLYSLVTLHPRIINQCPA